MIHKNMVPEPDALFSISTPEDPVYKQDLKQELQVCVRKAERAAALGV